MEKKDVSENYINLSQWAEENDLSLLLDYINHTENMYARLGLSKKNFSINPESKKLKITFTPTKNTHNGLHLDLENKESLDLVHGGVLAHFIDSSAGALLFTQLEYTKLPSTCESSIKYRFPVLLNNETEVVAFFPTEQDMNSKKVVVEVNVFQNLRNERKLCCEARLVMRGIKSEVLAKILS
jgi:acyl-coenzyme A thioesterase PaaI-like protein